MGQTFTISLLSSWGMDVRTINGENLADACKKARLSDERLKDLYEYKEEGKDVVVVAGKADCSCRFAPGAKGCAHDLKRVGILVYPFNLQPEEDDSASN